jgi:hypothetical protein
MTPRPQTLFDLFGDFTSVWPSQAVRQHTGDPHGDPESPQTWLAALNDSVLLSDIRTGASDTRVAVQAALTVGPQGFLGYSDGWPFVLVSMPDVEIRILPFTLPGRSVNLFASAGDDGAELVLEGLPVEIRLPAGLVEPHPDSPGAADGTLTIETGGNFEAGRLDDLKVIYRRGDVTSIFVHVRLFMNGAYEFDLQPAVPISFGACALSGIPCMAVHDFRLMPSPELAGDRFEWLRHGVEPWLPNMVGPYDGLFSVRSVDIDEGAQHLKDAVEWFNDHRKDPTPTAELVLGDLVVPFFGPLPVPPRHVTIGVRRKVLDPGDLSSVFAFDRAPVYLEINGDPKLHFVVESFYYQSQPADSSGPPSGLASGRQPGTPEGLGLTFTAELVIGADTSPQQAIEIGLDEDYTLTAGYKRGFSTSDGLPRPNPGAEGTLDAMLHWQIANTVIVDIIALRVGFSLGRYFGAHRSFKDSALGTGDLFVSMPPTGSDDSWFRLRALDGQPVAFAIENLGWRLGQLHFEGLALPDGVVAYFGSFPLLIYELGLSAEDGATYVSFSGGVLIKRPAGLDGGVTVKRLRFRVAGDETLPRTKLDGFFIFFSNADKSVEIQAGGYYTEQQVDGTVVREIGLTGTAGFTFGPDKYKVGLDLLLGDSRSPALSFDYLMAQAFYKGTFPAPGGFEITGARVLYARNMVPKLTPVDSESRELRYYRWYKESNDPLTVPGDRRLASWRAEDDAWALGGGLSASMPAFGKVVDLTVFVLVVHASSENGVLVVGEVFAFHNKRTLGYLALEVDRRNHRTSFLVGVDARASSFVQNAPAWMDGIGKFTGTLFISNSPGTFAIGRLSDQSTWLTLRFDVDLWLKSSLVIAICVELVEGGPKGFGMTARIEGGIGKKGVIRLTYNAGWSLTVLFFTTGSSDYAAVISIFAGIRFELFGFLRIGVSARMDFRVVGTQPARGELTAEIRLETPWFLPDVTWRLDCQFGELAPGDLSSAVQPLRTAGAMEPATNRQLSTHLERFDPSWNGDGVAPVHSVNELGAPTRSEQERLANLDADTGLRPVAIDATVAVLWSVAVNDKLGLGSVASGLGDQQSGDLTLTYDLVGIAVRRRARFGPDRSWQPLEQKLELGADFSSSSGVQLSGSFAPQVLSKTWDADVQIDGQPATKKLLLNGVAPYEFTTANAEVDEELVRLYPSWPCCRVPDDKDLYRLFHTLDWHSVAGGVPLTQPASWVFTDSTSRLRFLRPAWAHAAGYAGYGAGTMVAAAEIGTPGVVARVDFEEDAAFVRASLAWPPGARVTLVAFDGDGAEVARRELGAGTGGYQGAMFGAKGRIRRLEIRAYSAVAQGPAGLAGPPPQMLLEVGALGYVGLGDYLDMLLAEKACSGGAPGGSGAFDGTGKLSFLPNHEYEVKLTTRVTVAHPSTQPTTADVDEFVYFRTKGLPGLNAVARAGEELEPYVRGAYAGGRAGFVYRTEPVTLAFSEGFQVAVPLDARPPAGAPEHTTLLQMQLVVTPAVASAPATAFTVTADDWIVAHRGAAPPPPLETFPWRGVLTKARGGPSPMISVDPFRLRLTAMTQRPAVTCGLSDATHVTGTVLVAPPQGGGPDPGATPPGSAELWAAGARFTASVRTEGAPFVDRRPFVEGDETALAIRGAGSWIVSGAELQATGTGLGLAAFGDPDWDHLTVSTGLSSGATGAGVGFGLPATGTAGALFAIVENGTRLVVRRGDDTGQLVELGAVALPAASDTLALQVTLFDDRLRAAVGEAVVEVDRGDTPSGPVCLLADGPASFSSLQVQGLELYEFPFAVSRFRSFADHIGSWQGRLDEAPAGAMGGGGSSATVAELWSTTADEIRQAMAADAPSADRDRVFAAWVDGLGLPLRDELTAVELTRVVEGTLTSALLLESPEPLDFTEEIAVTLTHRVRVAPPPVRPPRAPIGPVAPSASQAPGIRERLQAIAFAPPPIDGGRGLPPVDQAILDVAPRGHGLALQLAPAFGAAGRLSAIAFPSGTPILYEGPVRPGLAAGLPAIMLADPVGPLGALPAGSELPDAIANAEADTVLLASEDLRRLFGVWPPHPTEVDVAIPVEILQSGDARRALVIPLSGQNATPLSPDTYRLSFRLVRKRWETTDPVDALNTYDDSATLLLAF